MNIAEAIKVFEHIKSNFIYYDLLNVEDTIPFLKIRFIETMKYIMIEEVNFLSEKQIEYPRDFLVDFWAFGTYGIILKWIKNRYSPSPSKIAKNIIILYTHSYPKVFVQ